MQIIRPFVLLLILTANAGLEEIISGPATHHFARYEYSNCRVSPYVLPYLASGSPYPGTHRRGDRKADGCMYVSTFYLARHCSRYMLSDKNLERFRILYESTFTRKDDPTFKKVSDWLSASIEEMRNHAGECSACGLQDVADIGERFAQDRRMQISWEATYRLRTQYTAVKWQSTLGDHVKMVTEFPVVAVPCSEDDSQRNLIALSHLRPFDTCKNYVEFFKRMKKQKPWRKEHRLDAAQHTILRSLGFTAEEIDKIPADTAEFLSDKTYSFCKFDADTGKNSSRWCSLMSVRALQLYSKDEDMERCTTASNCSAPGEEKNIGYRHICLLVRQMLDFLEHNRNYDWIPVHAAFAHDDTLIPFLTFLGLQGDPFHVNQISSMSANIRLDLFDCSHLYMDSVHCVVIYINERFVPHPDCEDGVCTWEVFKHKLDSVLDEIGGCSAATYATFCGEIGCYSKSS